MADGKPLRLYTALRSLFPRIVSLQYSKGSEVFMFKSFSIKTSKQTKGYFFEPFSIFKAETQSISLLKRRSSPFWGKKTRLDCNFQLHQGQILQYEEIKVNLTSLPRYHNKKCTVLVSIKKLRLFAFFDEQNIVAFEVFCRGAFFLLSSPIYSINKLFVLPIFHGRLV